MDVFMPGLRIDTAGSCPYAGAEPKSYELSRNKRSLSMSSSHLHSRNLNRNVMLAVLMIFLLFAPAVSLAAKWETLFTAQDVRDHLSTPAGREQALAFCRRMGITKVYLESFRDGYQADATTLETARDFFRKAGLEVSGSVATTQLGKPSTGWHIVACYTNRANEEHLSRIFRYTARLFNEIIIDDFFFTDCTCSECSAAKGDMSWGQYRQALMLLMSRDNVLAPARAVNPHVKIILKFPQWYDEFQDRGYTPDKQTALYDRIWVGTETRDPASQQWGHKQQYEGYFIYRWLSSIAGAKTGGAWFDLYGTNPAIYMDQAWTSILAGAREIFLFDYGSLIAPENAAQVGALVQERPQLDVLAKLVGQWKGIPAYKPVSSDPGSEPYVFDQVGMLGIPLAPTAKFPAEAHAAMFAEYAMSDPEFVSELGRFLSRGGTAFLTEGLAHRLSLDPRLGNLSLDLPKGQLVREIKSSGDGDIGNGRLVVFSDSLLKLTYVDNQDRVEQVTPSLHAALMELRKQVADFTVTSLDAPPRVAVYPMSGRVAVMNYTELPVACHIRQGRVRSRHETIFAAEGAHLGPDGEMLYLPPHSLILVK